MKRQSKINNSLPRMQKIICIVVGPIEVLQRDGTVSTRTGDRCPIELYETYTTPGPVVTEDGELCYPINEHGGTEMLAQRFVTYKRSRKTASKLNKH